jgi:hypothetical protein
MVQESFLCLKKTQGNKNKKAKGGRGRSQE